MDNLEFCALKFLFLFFKLIINIFKVLALYPLFIAISYILFILFICSKDLKFNAFYYIWDFICHSLSGNQSVFLCSQNICNDLASIELAKIWKEMLCRIRNNNSNSNHIHKHSLLFYICTCFSLLRITNLIWMSLKLFK